MNRPLRRFVYSAGETLRSAAVAAGLAEEGEPPAPLFVHSEWPGRLGRGRFTIGRAFDCDRRVDDPTVSRHHVELRFEDERWVVSDLRSLNGVYLNGRRVWRAVVEAGDVLTLGGARMVFEPRERTRSHATEALTA
jgi:hypothetical protein